MRADQQGAYLVRVAQTRTGSASASRTLGLVSPAAEEYRRLGVDREALIADARAGAGRVLDTAAFAEVWRHDIRADAFPTTIWPWLLVLAMAMFQLDVGVRRVALTRTDLRRARAWLGSRVGLGQPMPEAVPGLAELRAAKSRSDRRIERRSTPPPATTPAREPAVEGVAAEAAPLPEPPPAAVSATAPAAGMRDVAAPAGDETLAERLARRRRSPR
jgi:hypothetical protein